MSSRGTNSGVGAGGGGHKRRQPSVPTLPNVRDILRGGGSAASVVAGAGQGKGNEAHQQQQKSRSDGFSYSSQPSREMPNKPPSSHRKPGASSEAFSYATAQRTTEARFPASSHGGGDANAKGSSSSAPKETVESFSFRIGTRFAGFEAAGSSSGVAGASPSSSPTTSSSRAPAVSHRPRSFEEGPTTSTPAHFSPPSQSNKGASSAEPVEELVVEEMDADIDGDEDYLGHLAAEERRVGGHRGGSAEEDGEEGMDFAEEENDGPGMAMKMGGNRGGGASHAEARDVDPEAAAQRRAAAAAKRIEHKLFLRTASLERQIRRMAPAVRDWHALAAARPKTLVVEMDTDIEVRRDELAPYLAPAPPAAASGKDRSVRGEEKETAEESATKTLSSADLWACTKMLRSSRHAREAQRTVVTGGKAAIRRIWREYNIVPNVVYLPDDEPIPNWCLDPPASSSASSDSAASPTHRRPIIVRAPGASINKDLLSADLSDGFAAEFTLDERSPIFRHGTATFSGRSDVYSDVAQEAARDASSEAARFNSSTAGLDPALLYQDPKHSKINLRASVLLSESRIPSNVGIAVKAAIESGLDAVILDRCVDMLSEKVIRASEGTMLNPKARIFQLNEAHGVKGAAGAADVIQKACLRHNLLPLVTVPSQEAVPAFQMAQELFYGAEKYDEKMKYAAKAAAAAAAEAEAEAKASSAEKTADASSSYSDDRTDDEKLNALALIRGGAAECPPPRGAMLMLGSETFGLHHIVGSWDEGQYADAVPYRAVTLSMPDFRVDSINVAVAGGILMKMFRPAARKEHRQLFRLGVVPEGAEEVSLLPKAQQQKQSPSAEATNVGAEDTPKSH